MIEQARVFIAHINLSIYVGYIYIRIEVYPIVYVSRTQGLTRGNPQL